MNAQAVAPPPKQSVRTLLSDIVDYAGLFPPSMVSMQEAAANFAAYHSGPHGWMLGRFVLPAARLAEFREAAEGLFTARQAVAPERSGGRGPFRRPCGILGF